MTEHGEPERRGDSSASRGGTSPRRDDSAAEQGLSPDGVSTDPGTDPKGLSAPQQGENEGVRVSQLSDDMPRLQDADLIPAVSFPRRLLPDQFCSAKVGIVDLSNESTSGCFQCVMTFTNNNENETVVILYAIIPGVVVDDINEAFNDETNWKLVGAWILYSVLEAMSRYCSNELPLFSGSYTMSMDTIPFGIVDVSSGDMITLGLVLEALKVLLVSLVDNEGGSQQLERLGEVVTPFLLDSDFQFVKAA